MGNPRDTENGAESTLRKRMIRLQLLPLVLLLLVLPSCGGTWIDDDGNFRRVFGFSTPEDVKVLHSYYWKSAHWSAEYRYFISLKASSKFTSGLTSSELMISAVPDGTLSNLCGDERPQWFLPKSLADYEVWAPKAATGYHVFRDKADGTLFLCDERL
jgi:hypothetical protein